MDRGRAPYYLRRRKSRRCAQPGGLDTEDSPATKNGPNLPYLDPWIVTLLLEYKESVIKTDGQLGRVLKVLNKPRVHKDAEQDPETILLIGDGLHYIEVMVAGKAAEMIKQSVAQSGFSAVIGQFIVLQNYTVNFKSAAKVEDCRFYLTLECFQVMPMKREEKGLQNCNRAMSVLQKIRELWQKSFVTQIWFNSEQESQSVSQVMKEMNQDIFTVPAKYLVISAENEAALFQSYISNTPQAVSEGDGDIEDNRSTVSFSSADSASLDGSLENPWDAVPGIILSSSSDASGTSRGHPQMQQMLLASPAEEASPDSNTCISHFPEPCDNMAHSSSEHAAPAKFPSLFRFQNREFLHETASRKSDLITPTTSSQASQLADSIPCGQPLNKPCLHNSVLSFSSVGHSNEGNLSSEPVSESRKGCPSLAHGAQERTARWKHCETEKHVSAKRKQGPSEEESSEAFSPTCSGNPEAVGHCSTETVTKSSNPSRKHVNRYLPLNFASTPKKRRLEGIQDQQSPVFAHCSYTERFLEKRSEQVPRGVITRKSKQIGVQQKETAKGDGFHFIPNPPTPELCSQVQSVRISRALLEWARWVFSNAEKQ